MERDPLEESHCRREERKGSKLMVDLCVNVSDEGYIWSSLVVPLVLHTMGK